jgi:voltage-gated potassium channel
LRFFDRIKEKWGVVILKEDKIKASSLKLRIFQIIEKGNKHDKASLRFDYFIITLILLNTIAIFLETFDEISSIASVKSFFDIFEISSVIVFSLEFLLRIWTSDLKFPHRKKIVSWLRFIVSPMAFVDLLAILPTPLGAIFKFGFDLRILRLLRVFKLFRYSHSFRLIGGILKDKRKELSVTIFINFLLMLIAAYLMYEIESIKQPVVFKNIIDAFWWAVATLTTVGYGDIYPITTLGRVLAGVIAILGVGLIALPTAIISYGFVEEFGKQRKRKYESEGFTFCPHCGQKIKKQ